MEDCLNKLKSAWTKLDNTKNYSNADLQKIVKQKSKNEILKIKQKMIVEFYISILLFAILFIAIIIFNSSNILYASIFFTLLIGISFIPYKKIKNITIDTDNNVKDYLNDFLITFKKLYINTYSTLIPFALIGSFLISYNVNLCFLTIKQLIILTIAFILIYLIGLFLQKAYFNWLYGNNINQIKKIISDLINNN